VGHERICRVVESWLLSSASFADNVHSFLYVYIVFCSANADDFSEVFAGLPSFDFAKLRDLSNFDLSGVSATKIGLA
jgi:hypothetical protein